MQDNEIPRKWSHAVAVWWSMAWRIGLWFFVVMALVITLCDILFPFNLPLQATVQNWAVVILVPILGVYAVYAALNRNYGGFRVALVPRREKTDRDRGLFSPLIRLKNALCRTLSGKDDAAAQQEKNDKTHAKSGK